MCYKQVSLKLRKPDIYRLKKTKTATTIACGGWTGKKLGLGLLAAVLRFGVVGAAFHVSNSSFPFNRLVILFAHIFNSVLNL